MAEALVTIGTFAVLTGLSVATLRHYDEMALLQPADVDRRTGYRRYERSQVGRGRTIHALRKLQLPLEEIRSASTATTTRFARCWPPTGRAWRRGARSWIAWFARWTTICREESPCKAWKV